MLIQGHYYDVVCDSCDRTAAFSPIRAYTGEEAKNIVTQHRWKFRGPNSLVCPICQQGKRE